MPYVRGWRIHSISHQLSIVAIMMVLHCTRELTGAARICDVGDGVALASLDAEVAPTPCSCCIRSGHSFEPPTSFQLNGNITRAEMCARASGQTVIPARSALRANRVPMHRWLHMVRTILESVIEHVKTCPVRLTALEATHPVRA